MILPDFILESRKNQDWEYSGMDSPEYCLNKKLFKSYPHKISYKYNSRGFRDNEWPDDLENCIWCFGDSFTVGLGSPIEHTWVNLLQQRTGRRCINISMDGASNQWISRKIKKVQQVINPSTIIVHWSYVTRDEDTNESLSDEQRRIEDANYEYTEYYNRFLGIVNQHTDIINTAVPTVADPIHLITTMTSTWNNIKGTSWPDRCPASLAELYALPTNIQHEMKNIFSEWDTFEVYLKTIEQTSHFIRYSVVDMARDGHHYDLLTATDLVDNLVTLVKQ